MIYLINSESYRLIDKEIKKIVKNNNYLSFNACKFSVNDLIEEASYVSLDNIKKYIVVSHADYFGTGKISDADSELLLRYLTKKNDDTTIIFTTQNGIDLRKKLVKVIKDNGSVINIAKLDKRGINSILTSYLKEYNYYIDYKTVNYIMDNSFNSLDIMFNELDKIMLYYCFPCTIKYTDVVNIVGEEKTSNNFAFVTAVIDRNLKDALKILNSLKVYKVEPTVLVVLLAREYRLMYYVKNMYNRNNLSDIMKYLSLADWQVNKLYTNASKYSNKELLDNLVKLCNIDMDIKKGNIDKDISLYGFLMDACS